MLQPLSQFAQAGADTYMTSSPNLSYTDSTTTELGPAFWIPYSITILVIVVLSVVGLWKMFQKAGKPGWAAIVPFYNIIVLLQIAGKPVWWFILYFIPFVNIVIQILVSIEVAKKFGKDAAFGVVGLWLFGPIGYLMLGFGKAQYQGAGAAPVAAGAGTMGQPAQPQQGGYPQPQAQPDAPAPQQPADPNQPQNPQNPQGPLPPQPPTNLVQ